MAEEEKIQAHAKKAVRALTNKKKKWRERIIDFLYEIFIIIVAVSITLWFHNWSDERHEQEQVKEFLIGIRANLVEDRLMMRLRVKNETQDRIAYLDSVLHQINSNKIDAKYIDTNSNRILDFNYIAFDNGLYQSFSASGNLRLIKNQELSSHISSVYYVLSMVENKLGLFHDKTLADCGTYIGTKTGIDSNFNYKISAVIHQTDVQYFLQSCSSGIKNWDKNLNRISGNLVDVIHEIDKELKDNFDYEVSDKN